MHGCPRWRRPASSLYLPHHFRARRGVGAVQRDFANGLSSSTLVISALPDIQIDLLAVPFESARRRNGDRVWVGFREGHQARCPRGFELAAWPRAGPGRWSNVMSRLHNSASVI